MLSDFNNEAVLDRETGLVWEKSPSLATYDWWHARYACTNSGVGGRKGWRLPSVIELASLVDPSVGFPGPTLPAGHPFTNVLSTGYWSATTIAGSPTDRWSVGFNIGDVGPVNNTNSGQFWCVRGAMNADTY